ncbi:cell division cycle protein 20 homolog [Haliotis cracherodii]|uniref:cell division cycle protein 20 homolog n=1 Tax=Haliotis cracherodii TaxID=6455 RepID=UPI0039ECB346
MSHFNFESLLSEVTKMDGPIPNAPMMRWQRKALESGLRVNVPDQALLSPWKQRLSRTPGKTPKTPSSGKITPFTTLTPGKTPGKSSTTLTSKTPNKKTPKTPKHGVQDRFIPNRSTTDMDMGHYAVMNNENDVDQTENTYRQQLNETLAGGRKPKECNILSYTNKAPQAKEGHMNSLSVLYSTNKRLQARSIATRYIAKEPERILDAPDMMDDYYLNLLDWSNTNLLAVCLGSALYLWNATNSSISHLFRLSTPDLYISSVGWIKEGNVLAVGINNGAVQLWDTTKEKLIRTMGGHAARVGALSWNSYILSSGSRTGAIHHHDVRAAEHTVGSLHNHSQEVCGLKWSGDGRYLASGGNDNLLNIWDTTLGTDVSPLHVLTDHQAAVKALAWCPWQPHLLASGGGTADRHIRFWNVTTGACLASTDTNSQVCSMLWSKEYKELISGHGYSQNQLSIWKYPNMDKLVDLTGHSARVLCLTMSPDNQIVASAAADETIRIWKCFASDKQRKSSVSKGPTKDGPGLSVLRSGIR